ncbi:MAG: response regulator [Anaerolineae bacterium]|jgi:two-component system cell cycle response regulator DivK|uniref:response regulator n=1 Tax=Candidatus Flexifilum breve TaxID=3140694 RepID=UPI001AD142E1|nr:response regulator [Chloroflexota bacterium]MBK9745345.1 response regulator [Chloroflexota bacterium]MBN8634751.1 response regulator [Anaerolineae bacterium]
MLSLEALIIDDNTDNLTVLSQLLQIEGIRSIREPRAGNVANDLGRFVGVSLIFLDLEMATDGFALLQLFKSDRRYDGIPIIAYTVHTHLLADAKAAGFDGFIGKPVSAEEFPDQIATILRGGHVWWTP